MGIEVQLFEVGSTNQPSRRNELAADKIISEIKHIQPDAEATFIKKDLTLLKNVDEVCEEVKAKEKKINLLFMTQGKYSSLKGREGHF